MSIAAIAGIGIGLLTMSTLSTALTPSLNSIRQLAYKMFPNELFPPVNLIELRHRGLISESVYKGEMVKQGFDDGRAGLLFEGSETLLNGYETVALFRRGQIDEGKRDEILGNLGYTEERITQLMGVTEQIPSAGDVIAFAVREVYSPEIARAFGQYEGVEDVLREAESDIKATGMTEDAFKKFWAAHWVLPSLRQGFEMLHRQIVSEDQLQQLMVASDIMPFWREKLTQMSFSPFTRVDVRRMHKLGTLDDSELVTSYRDLGYDTDKAEKLADFTRAYNQDPPANEETPPDIERRTEKTATRAAVLKAYRTAILTLEETVGLLEDLEYTPEAIDLYIASEDFTKQEEIQANKISTIKEAYVRRIYTFNEAVTLLGLLNLPSAQVDTLMLAWDEERAARASRPSKAELFKMHKAGVIDGATLRTELGAHGFSDKYIDWYMLLDA